VGISVDQPGARNVNSRIAFGEADLSAQPTSACLRLSM
jgi:hypothetical protein